MVTHNMRQVLQLGDRLIMLHAGQVILHVSGKEKEAMEVEDLLEKFYEVRGEDFFFGSDAAGLEKPTFTGRQSRS